MQIDAFIDYITGVRRYSPRTVEIYRKVLSEYESNQEEITATGLRNYEVWLLDERKESPRTVGQHMSVLSSYCRWLMKQGQLGSNPVRLVHRPKTEKRLPVFYRDSSMKEYFGSSACDASAEQLELLLQLPPGDRTAAALYKRRLRRMIVALLYGTGIRRSELISLDVGSVNFSRECISVLGKGDKMREIPIIASLSDEISLYLDAAGHMFGDSANGDTPLLRTPAGKRLYPVYVDRAVKEALGNVRDITGQKSAHILRHTLASELLDRGTDLNSIKELLGHSSLAATQVYTHNTIERLKKVYANAHPRATKNGGKNGD